MQRTGGKFLNELDCKRRGARAGRAEFKFSRLGRRDYVNAFIRHSEGGKDYFEIRGEIFDSDKGEGTDIFAVENGYVSVTPLHVDVTHHEKILTD